MAEPEVDSQADETEPTEAEKPWPRRLTHQIGKRIKYYRENRSPRMSASKLSDATEKLGFRVEYQLIANMETGRRTNISVAELMIIALALEVPPALLIAPVGAVDAVEGRPGSHLDPWEVYKWFTASGHYSTDFDFRGMINAYDRHDRAVRRLRRSLGTDQELEDVLDAVVDARAEIKGRGWPLPRLPESGSATSEEAERIRKLVEQAEIDRGIET